MNSNLSAPLDTTGYSDTLKEMFQQLDELTKLSTQSPKLPEPTPPILTPQGQAEALREHDSYQQRLVIADRQVSAPVEREAPLLPPTLPGHERPVLQLAGDPAVKREFVNQLMEEGRISKSTEREGWLTVRGSMHDLAQRWNTAAAVVAAREDRPLVAAAVHVDRARKDWPGGVVLGAASNHKALQVEATRAFVAGLPDTVVVKALDKIARSPSMLLDQTGHLDKDSLRQALNHFADPKLKPAEMAGRSASLGELASMSVNVTYLANLLGKDDSVAKQALDRVATIETITRQHVGVEAYESVKSAIAMDLAQAQGRNLRGAAAESDQEAGATNQAGQRAVASQTAGRSLDR